MGLEHRVVVIAGASSSVGMQLSADLAQEAAALALLERNPDKVAGLVGTLGLPAERVLTYAVDLLDEEAARRAAQAVVGQFGRVDALIHLVGGWTGGKTVADTPRDDLASMLNQHVWTTFHVLNAFVPHLIANRWGRILVIGSPGAARPSAKGSAYAAAKAGQEALLLALSQELKGTGVTANLLLVRQIDAQRQKLSTPSAENAGWTTPEELSAAIRFLMSDEAGTVNGARLPVFGGYA